MTEKTSDGERQEKAWGVLIGASLCIFAGNASVPYYTFGIFLPDIIASTHWQSAALAASIGPALFAASIMAPVTGLACDRFGTRTVTILGGPAIVIGFLILGLLPQNSATFAIALILLNLLYFAGSPVPQARGLAGWFNKRRGMALSIMFASGSVGVALWPQYAALLIGRLGWRHAYIAMGTSAATTILLAGLFLLKDAPEAAQASGGAPLPGQGLLAREALRTGRFWKVASIFLILTAVFGGTALVFPVILRSLGTPPATAASVMSVVGLTMFLGRLLLGLTLDRFFAPYVTVAITLVGMSAFVIMFAKSDPVTLFVAAGLIGFGLGSEYAVTAYIVSRAFGVRAFGSIYGMITAATSIGAALGPAVIGSALVSGTRIATIAAVALAALIIAILLLLTLSRSDLPYAER